MSACHRPRRMAALLLPMAVAACVVGPNYHRPSLPAAAGYGAQATTPAGTHDMQLIGGMDIPTQWWRVFHSDDLDALVAEALKNNSTIEAAKAALRAAREQASAQRGADYPSVAISMQPSHQAFAHDLATPLQSGASVYDLNTTQVSVSYAPDLFGANARAVESLVAEADQQRFELEAARLTLASNVVLSAVQDALLRAQIDETRSIIADQRETLASFRRQAMLGQASEDDLAAQAALLAQAEATLPPLQKQYRINRDLLAALVGRTPAQTPDIGFDFNALALPTRLPVSLPARLVEQRPDVRIAEAQLHAASAQVGIAVAARLPNLQIDAAAGGSAVGLAPAFGPAATFWNLTGTLTQPVFEGGALLHRQRAAEATYTQALAQYRGTVVGAFQNTADVLHALWTDADAQSAAEAFAAAAHKSLEIARRQFALGDISRLVLLGAQQADAQARLGLLQARANRYADVAALFQALGGGWWNEGAGS